jgi:hypothetical protein
MTIPCPCCGGSGSIEPAAPVPLSQMQFKIWSAIRQSRHGLSAPQIVERVYSDRIDGGPLHAKTCIYLTIRAANLRLKSAGVEIASTTGARGGIYKIQPIGYAP